MAARWEIESRLDFSSVRKILHRGLRFHQKSKPIWLECFWLELIHTIEARKRRDILTDTVADCSAASEKHQKHIEAAKIVFKNVRLTFYDEPLFWLSFAKQIVDIENNDSDLRELLDHIIQNVDEFCEDGHVHGQLIRFRNSLFLESKENMRGVYISTLEEFDSALKLRPLCDSLRLEYAKFCVFVAEKFAENDELYSQIYQRITEFIKWLISHLTLTCIPESLLISLIDFSVNCKFLNKTENLLTLAFKHIETKHSPFSPFPFMQRRITLQILKGDMSNIDSLLKEAMESSITDEEVMTLWGLVLSALTSKGQSNRVMELLESFTLNSYRRRDLPLPECFIRIKASNLNPSAVLDLFDADYRRLAELSPCRFQFFQTVVDILLEFEACGGEISWKVLSSVLEDAVCRTGHDEPRAWLLYIELDGRFNGHRMASELNWRALKCLNKDRVESYVEGLAKYKSCDGIIL